MEPPRRWLIAYDIAEDPRRARIAHLLGAHGDRVQYSVFVVDLRPARLVRLRTELTQIMDVTDSILVVDLGPVGSLAPGRFSYIGRQRPITPSGPLVL
ncbi:MAG: CRISPR-associated endonuclease Cas2 [Actinomycetota bacterium]|jgi:CRISPR-associated protein Cas2|nr:CRISPR-associated endonuclease Cas2 [Actinomycetota bacterium]